MTNGEKFKEVFQISQVDDCDLNVYAWLPIHDAIEIPLEWWNAEYEEPTAKNDLGVDCISRKSIKQKLQEHHDFFVNAYGGFSNLPQNDKSRVDEITNCIAMVVNEPPVAPQEPRKGRWLDKQHLCNYCSAECSSCHKRSNGYVHDNGFSLEHKYYDFCPNCGCAMVEPQESEVNND